MGNMSENKSSQKFRFKLALGVVLHTETIMESVLRSELYWVIYGLLQVLKVLRQVLVHVWLTKVGNGTSPVNSTQKELSNETLMKIN